MFPRFLEEVVQRGHDADHHSVARGTGEHFVKCRVLSNGRSPRLQLPALRLKEAFQLCQVLRGDARGGDARNGRLEHPSHVEELLLQIAAVAQDRRERRDKPVDVELLRKRAPAVARDEQPDGLQRPERVANRAAADAEPLGKWPLGWQGPPRREGAVQNQQANAVGDLFANTRLSGRLDPPGIGSIGGGGRRGRVAARPDWPALAGRSVLADRPALDTRASGCQNSASNWLDHWASVAWARSASRGEIIRFTVTGSPQSVSRATVEYSRGAGPVTAIVESCESYDTALSMAVKAESWTEED